MSRARDLADLGNESAGGITSSDISDIQVKPHIIPNVLYPAVGGKLLDGSTSHSGNYGTPQTQTGGDGRSYYYTDIKGSKPIKDPRIGGHFGSQRHKFKSIQLLDQETATHGINVYSADGREWVRFVGNFTANYNSSGNFIAPESSSTTGFVEIVGYFSDANWLFYAEANRTIRYTIDGGTEDGTDHGGSNIETPLKTRYVDPSSVLNLSLGLTLGIHTLKLRDSGSSEPLFYGIELIAQDTASTARRSEIKIPKQNVVSYGKKF